MCFSNGSCWALSWLVGPASIDAVHLKVVPPTTTWISIDQKPQKSALRCIGALDLSLRTINPSLKVPSQADWVDLTQTKAHQVVSNHIGCPAQGLHYDYKLSGSGSGSRLGPWWTLPVADTNRFQEFFFSLILFIFKITIMAQQCPGIFSITSIICQLVLIQCGIGLFYICNQQQ